MIKSIKFKLWLTFLITLVLSTTAMLLLSHASVKKGFLDYVTQQAIDRLQNLEISVLEIYERENSLEPLRDNNRLWLRLKYRTFREFIEQQTREAISNNQPPPHPSVKAQERVFIDQLILTDPTKKLIVGNAFKNAEYSWRELIYEDQLIGYLGYIKPKDFMRSVDKLFVSQQLKVFALFSLAIVAASFAVSMLVSRWLVKPLGDLTKGARQIADGDFSVRIQPNSTDELGMLCNNFNELAKTLSANEKARKQWVADISHEMRTPLAVLKAQIEAMQDGIRPTTPENLELLKNKIDALHNLISDLYDLSLTDLGAMTYNKSLLCLYDLLEEIADDYVHRLEEKGLTFQMTNSLDKNAGIYGDYDRLAQLLRNLFENSYRYTDTPGQLIVTCNTTNKLVEIVFTDSAPGVPADQIDKIFDRLYRVENSRNRATGGAGLGLSICKNIVEAHSGTITAMPAPSGGLTITLRLPLSHS